MEKAKRDLESWALDRSISNMLDYYRSALLGLMKGRTIVDSIPQGTRNSLVEYGVIRKFGSKFELTNRGTELLNGS